MSSSSLTVRSPGAKKDYMQINNSNSSDIKKAKSLEPTGNEVQNNGNFLPDYNLGDGIEDTVIAGIGFAASGVNDKALENKGNLEVLDQEVVDMEKYAKELKKKNEMSQLEGEFYARRSRYRLLSTLCFAGVVITTIATFGLGNAGYIPLVLANKAITAMVGIDLVGSGLTWFFNKKACR
jgi:hypothetical protein